MAYLGFAVPIGRIADRVGRGRVFLAGHLALLGVYLVLRFADLGAGARAVHAPALRPVLRVDRRGAHGAREPDHPRAPAHERLRPHHHRHRDDPLHVLGRLRGHLGRVGRRRRRCSSSWSASRSCCPRRRSPCARTRRRRRRDHHDLADADRRVRCPRGRRTHRRGGRRRAGRRQRTPVAAGGGSTPRARLAGAVAAPHIVFRDTARGAGYGRVGIVPLAHPAARPAITGLSCDRVYVAGGAACAYAPAAA